MPTQEQSPSLEWPFVIEASLGVLFHILLGQVTQVLPYKTYLLFDSLCCCPSQKHSSFGHAHSQLDALTAIIILA